MTAGAFHRVIIVLLVCSFATDAQQLRPVRELLVFDATGKRVDFVVGSGPPAAYGRLAFSVDDTLFTVLVNRVTFFGDGEDVFFEGLNCTGTPWLRRMSTTALFPVTQVVHPGWTVYLADRDAAVATITALSALPRSDGSNLPGPCQNITERVIADALMAKPLVDLSRHFVAPFSTR